MVFYRWFFVIYNRTLRLVIMEKVLECNISYSNKFVLLSSLTSSNFLRIAYCSIVILNFKKLPISFLILLIFTRRLYVICFKLIVYERKRYFNPEEIEICCSNGFVICYRNHKIIFSNRFLLVFVTNISI